MKLFSIIRISNALIIGVLLFGFVFSGIKLSAQNDSINNNVIKVNLTNPLFFGYKSFILSYERILKNNQSFSISLGNAHYGKLIDVNVDSIQLDIDYQVKETGFHISGDYRFYLKKENQYAPPRGLYIGPYYSYNHFNRVNGWTLQTEPLLGTIETDFTMNIHTVGFELGYQFVFKRRVTLDLLLFGPGVGFYSINAGLSTTLTPDDESKFFEALNGFLAEKIPGYDRVIGSSEFSKTGSVKTTDAGFRYMVLLGFNF